MRKTFIKTNNLMVLFDVVADDDSPEKYAFRCPIPGAHVAPLVVKAIKAKGGLNTGNITKHVHSCHTAPLGTAFWQQFASPQCSPEETKWIETAVERK